MDLIPDLYQRQRRMAALDALRRAEPRMAVAPVPLHGVAVLPNGYPPVVAGAIVPALEAHADAVLEPDPVPCRQRYRPVRGGRTESLVPQAQPRLPGLRAGEVLVERELLGAGVIGHDVPERSGLAAIAGHGCLSTSSTWPGVSEGTGSGPGMTWNDAAGP